MTGPDQQLLEQVKASDMDAFKTLFEQYQPILFRNIIYRLHDEDLAHEIVQMTFIRVWEHRQSLKPHLAFLPYLLRISGNLIRDHANYKNVRARLNADLPQPGPSAGDDPEHALHYTMLEQEIIRVVNSQLPERCRTIFLLSRIEGKANNEIAALLKVSIKTVENQLTHALKILRKHLVNYL